MLILKSKQCRIPSQKYSVWIHKLLGKLFQSGWLFVRQRFPFCWRSSHTGFSEWGLGKRPQNCFVNCSGLLNETLGWRSHAQSVWFCSWVTLCECNIHLVNYLTGCLSILQRKKCLWLIPLLSDGEISRAQTALAAPGSLSAGLCLFPLHLDAQPSRVLGRLLPPASSPPATELSAFCFALGNFVRGIILPWTALEQGLAHF